MDVRQRNRRSGRFRWLGILIAVSLCVYCSFAAAETRVALVIGNSAYRNAEPLPNPVNDGRAVAAALRRLGFVVIEGVDQDKAGMRILLRRFRAELEGADASLFFYAGHGLQVQGDNYLVPVDAALETEVDLPFEAVAVDVVLDLMEQTTPLRLVFLDACRDNPLARRLARSTGRSRSLGIGRGLARMNDRAGTLIAFATEPDRVALDGTSDHSPFTAALLEHLETPGLEVRQMLSRVRASVITSTDGQQLPIDTSALTQDFYLKPRAPADPDSTTVLDALQAYLSDRFPSDDTLRWDFIRDSTDLEDFERFITEHPDSSLAPLARKRIAALSQPTPERRPRHDATHEPGEPAEHVDAPRPQRDTAADAASLEKTLENLPKLTLDWGAQQSDAQVLARYREAAAQGNADAQNHLGDMYREGRRGVSQDDAQATFWYRKAADQGNAAAQSNLAGMYREGRGGLPQDDAEAVAWLRKAAEQGLARAQSGLGDMYREGRSVSQDDAQATFWYRKAAERGNADAQHNLGVMYQRGRGVAQDDAQAVAWYREAAAQGNANAQNNLGVMYEHGRGVAQDDAQAVVWYRKAAEQGNALAQATLGDMYREGRGVSQDDAQAVAWFRKAAEQGDAPAQSNLGWMYQYGRGVPQDDAEAVAWYSKAAQQGNARAQSNLGWMHQSGRGVPQDDAEAVAWYRKAAQQGDAPGQTNLGWMYMNGRGVPRENAQAVAWFRKAAEQGNARAQNNLAVMYKTGRGVPQDDIRAAAWYRRAAEQNDAMAQDNLGGMYRDGRGVPQDDAQAVAWFRKAAEQGDAPAQYNLGMMYENGRGVPRDLARAAAWFRESAAQGHESASRALLRLELIAEGTVR